MKQWIVSCVGEKSRKGRVILRWVICMNHESVNYGIIGSDNDLSPVRHQATIWTMMTSSNGNIFRVTGHLCGKFTGPRWISRTKASDAELWCSFDMRPNIRLSKQSRGWWFETPPQSLWRHRDAYADLLVNWIHKNKLQRNSNQNTKHFIFKKCISKCHLHFASAPMG